MKTEDDARVEIVTKNKAIAFLGEAFRNCGLNKMTSDDVEDVRAALQSFVASHLQHSGKAAAGEGESARLDARIKVRCLLDADPSCSFDTIDAIAALIAPSPAVALRQPEPAAPSVEDIAQVIDPKAFIWDGKKSRWTWRQRDRQQKALDTAERILAHPASDREARLCAALRKASELLDVARPRDGYDFAWRCEWAVRDANALLAEIGESKL